MPSPPLRYSLLELNPERLPRRLAPARLRGAHVSGSGTELLQGIIRHPASSGLQLLDIKRAVFGKVVHSMPLSRLFRRGIVP